MKNVKSTARRPSVGSRIVEGLQEFLDTLERGEPIAEKFTCRQFELNVRQTCYDADAVRATRKLLGASQVVFARFLGVSPQTVRAWEQGTNTPSALASRFMDEIRLNPSYWKERLLKVVVGKSAG